MSDIVRRAILLSNKAHEGDKWGEYPYAVHLALTAFEVRQITSNEEAEAAAWLHDVIEDHPEYEELVKAEFPTLYDALKADARRDDETYDEYIQRLLTSGNMLAKVVKLADMRVNLRNDPPKRLKKRYLRNIVLIEASLGM